MSGAVQQSKDVRLMAATLAFLGLVFRRLHLKPQTCEPGTTCVSPAALKRPRQIFWVVAALFLALPSLPRVAPFFL